MQLTKGQRAPLFTTKDVSGTTIDLEAYKGKYVLLSFFRYAGCPFCNMTLIQLIQRYENFSNRGLQTVVFFQSPEDTVNEYVSSKHPPFPVVADPKKEIYDKYSVQSSKVGAVKSTLKVPVTVAAILRGDVVQGKIDGDAFLMPAHFIVGPDGSLVKAYYGTDFGDKIPMIEIEELLLTI